LSQYFDWLGKILQGNFGSSYSSHESVTSIMGAQLPVSLELVVYAFMISIGFALPLALLAARRPNGIIDRFTMMFSMAGVSIANYVLAVVLSGVRRCRAGLPGDRLRHDRNEFRRELRSLTLPAVAVALPLLGFYTRLLRRICSSSSSRRTTSSRGSKGVSPWRVIIRHALRNSLFGLITIVALNFGTLLGAIVIIEQIFSLPGLGDGLIQALTNTTSGDRGNRTDLRLMTVAGNVVADVLYTALDRGSAMAAQPTNTGIPALCSSP